MVGRVRSRPLRMEREKSGRSPTEPVRLRVLIAEDQYLMREGTRRLLQDEGGLEVVGVAADYDGVIAETRRLKPDVVLMDIKMPPTFAMEGIEAAHVIKAERPRTGVLVLTQHDDESYLWALLQLVGPMQSPNWRAGCAGTCRRSTGCSTCATPPRWNRSKPPSPR